MSAVQDWYEQLQAVVRVRGFAVGNERLLAKATGKLRGTTFVVEGLNSPVLAHALLAAAERIPRPPNVKALEFTGFTNGPLNRPVGSRKRPGQDSRY